MCNRMSRPQKRRGARSRCVHARRAARPRNARHRTTKSRLCARSFPPQFRAPVPACSACAGHCANSGRESEAKTTATNHQDQCAAQNGGRTRMSTARRPPKKPPCHRPTGAAMESATTMARNNAQCRPIKGMPARGARAKFRPPRASARANSEAGRTSYERMWTR